MYVAVKKRGFAGFYRFMLFRPVHYRFIEVEQVRVLRPERTGTKEREREGREKRDGLYERHRE